MALFGFHLVLTLLAATIFSKFVSRFTLCDWFIFKGLRYYLLTGAGPPNKPNAKRSVRKGGDSKRRSKGVRYADEDENAEEQLLCLPLSSKALLGAPLYDSLTWAFNYFIFALAVYYASDLFTYLFPTNEDRNTSLTWILCAILLFAYVLTKLTLVRFSSPELSAERNLLICFGAFSFLLSMLFTMFGDRHIDIGFQQGYHKLTVSVNDYLLAEGFNPIFSAQDDKPPLIVIFTLAATSAATATVLFWPSVQYASMYVDALREAVEPLTRVCLHTTFFLPILVLLTYALPVKEHLCANLAIGDGLLDTLRVLALIAWTLMRCATARQHLQSFLNLPLIKLPELQQNPQMKWEERRRRVGYYASYFCAAAIHYYLPTFLVLSVGLMFKSLGGIRMDSIVAGGYGGESTPNSNSTRGDLIQLLLAADIQKPLWSTALVNLLGINASLGVLGVAYKKTFDASRI